MIVLKKVTVVMDRAKVLTMVIIVNYGDLGLKEQIWWLCWL